MKHILNFFVFSNLYVALPVSALAWSSFYIFNQPVNYQILIFIYCATYLIYNVHRVVGLNQIPESEMSPRHIWAKKNLWFVYSSAAISLGVMLLMLYELGQSFAVTLIPAAVIAIGYSAPIVYRKGKYWRLRDVPFAKVFLVSLTVGYVTTYLPLHEFIMEDPFNLILLGFLAARAFFLLAITIPFDIRDYDFDKPSNLNTLPLLFGIEKAKTIGIYALAFFAGISFYLFQGSSFLSIALLISAASTAWIISYAQKNSSEYYYSLLVEGTMILQFVLIALFI
jgi:4-hydroxybenzoate polyprenyltransferase